MAPQSKIKKSNQVLEAIEKEANKIFLPIIGSLKGKFLEKIVKRYKPKNCLEIGTLVGKQSIFKKDCAK